jgi:hypothetical protein
MQNPNSDNILMLFKYISIFTKFRVIAKKNPNIFLLKNKPETNEINDKENKYKYTKTMLIITATKGDS